MSNVTYEFTEDYIRSLIKEKDELLIEMRAYAEKNHVPIIEKECEDFYKFLLNILKPEKILELGTAIGYSAIVFAKTSGAFIKSVEISEDMIKLAEENIKNANLENNIKVINKDALEFLLETKDSYDLIFIDAAKGQYEKYFDEAVKHLNRGGTIICDNVLFRGMIANQNLVKRRKITIVKRLRKFLNRIKDDGSYSSTIVTIGDGVLLVRRISE